MIPVLPDRNELADEIRRVAGVERVEPAAVEKDFHLTRLIWALAEKFGDGLLLKGGTCLSKVDLGYHRMSEDADFVIPWNRDTRQKGTNARQTNRVRDALKEISAPLGMRLSQPDGEAFEKRSHVIWSLDYPGEFPPTGLVVEVSLRQVLRPARRARLRQLLNGPVAAPYSEAFCWALDADEVRAEKVRAAFTREEPEVRDFFDLDLLRRKRFDFSSAEFVSLVDAKLQELEKPGLAHQARSFGLSTEDIRHLKGPGMLRLTSVLRADDGPFDVEAAIRAFNRIWKRK